MNSIWSAIPHMDTLLTVKMLDLIASLSLVFLHQLRVLLSFSVLGETSCILHLTLCMYVYRS